MQDNNGVILVDADSIYFKAACVTKTKRSIKRNIDSLMAEIDGQCFMNELKVAVKGRGNFRKGIDKDLLQIPGNHYNFNKKTHRFVSDDEAHKLLMIQCLTGDRTDNIPGIKGIGPKKAEKILEGVNTDVMWRYVKKAWQEHNAGDPKISLRLLSMIKTWKEYEDIKSSIEDKTLERKQDSRGKREELLQECRVREVPERNSRVTERC